MGLLSRFRSYFLGSFNASMLVDTSSVGDVEALPGVQRAIEGVA